jgi:hypothetical protein
MLNDFWFQLGYVVFNVGVSAFDKYPPLSDPDAQREWLDGFLLAETEEPELVVSSEDSLRCRVPYPELLAQLLGGLSDGTRS